MQRYVTITKDLESSIGSIIHMMQMRNFFRLLGYTSQEEQKNDTPRDLIDRSDSSDDLPYFEAILKLALGLPDIQDLSNLLQSIQDVYEKSPDDELLKWLLLECSASSTCRRILLEITSKQEVNRNAIMNFLKRLEMPASGFSLNLLATTLYNLGKSPHRRLKTLEILAKSNAFSFQNKSINEPYSTKFIKAVDWVQGLSDSQFEKLYRFYQTTTTNIYFLYVKYIADQNSSEFLEGPSLLSKRKLEAEFSTSDAEQVINLSTDTRNNSKFTYAYRKQWMEACWLVTKMDETLPLYRKKAARNLTDAEITNIFQELKLEEDGPYSYLNPFQRQLYSIALLREAMHRAIGEFVEPEVIIALVHCLMQEGTVLPNSVPKKYEDVFDVMTTALCYLVNDVVNVKTRTLEEANRSITYYAPFFTRLGVPFSRIAITEQNKSKEFKNPGVNYYSVHPELDGALEQGNVGLDIPEEEQEDQSQYQVYQAPVSIEDCVPPEIIACHFLRPGESDPEAKEESQLEDDTRRELNTIFDDLRKDNATTCQTYIHYLSSNSEALPRIRKVHEEHLQKFLKDEAEVIENRNIFQRWFNAESYLKKVTHDRNYLLMFHALMGIQGGVERVPYKTLRDAIVVLVKEYQHCWFLSSKKKDEARELLTSLCSEKINSIEALVFALSNAKLNSIQTDIQTNQDSTFWRRIKPVNASGSSRFQAMLDGALNLTSSCGGVGIQEEKLQELEGKLRVTVKDSAIPPITLDSLKASAGLFHYKDKGNAQVITKSFEQALEAQAMRQGLSGPVCS